MSQNLPCIIILFFVSDGNLGNVTNIYVGIQIEHTELITQSTMELNWSLGSTAIVLLSVMDEDYLQWTLLCAESIRTKGQYSGPIYIITDDPEWFKPFEEEYQLNLIAIPDVYDIKTLKCKIPQLVSSYPFLLYLDSDVVIGQPLQWIFQTFIKNDSMRKNCYLALFEDQSKADRKFQTGVIWMHGRSSMEFLNKWAELINSTIFYEDQLAFEATTYFFEDSVCTLPPQLLEIPKDLTFPEMNKPFPLLHVTYYMLKDRDSQNNALKYLKNVLKLTQLPEEWEDGTHEFQIPSRSKLRRKDFQ